MTWVHKLENKIGIALSDKTVLTIGMIIDMLTEKGNDDVKYKKVLREAIQEDFDWKGVVNMKKKKVGRILCIIGIVIISAGVYLVSARKEREDEVRQLSPILEYAKDVMTGEAFMDEGMEALEVYRDMAVNIQNVKITFEIEKIELDEKDKKGYIVAEYRISDWGDGRAKWTMKKDSGKWKVVDVYDRPDGYIPE